MCTALVDTGSVVSLVRKNFMDKIEATEFQTRALPQLTGITHTQLPVLGTTYLDVLIGLKSVKHLFAVVPDTFLETEVLLGSDILQQAKITWDSEQRIITWNNVCYPVYFLKLRPSRRRVRSIRVKKAPQHSTSYVRLKSKVVIPKYTAGVYPIDIDEEPERLIELSPYVAQCQAQTPLCLQITEGKTVFLPLVNSSRVEVTLKVGTLIGAYRCIESQDLETKEHSSRRIRIHNDLVPNQPSQGKESGQDRLTTLESIIGQQDWSHLTPHQRQQLKQLLMKNEAVFILEKYELGKFKDVSAHLNVTDPTPVRAPLFRYPDKAKPLIAEMLEEMRDKDIIEPSTAAWVSPIVLVKKPDGSQHMCLDYRKVNTHLQVDIQPLPRLEELVESAVGNKYYTSLDMKDAYYQIPLDEVSRDLTTFTDGTSLYRFKRLPFGLSCSPAIFVRVMQNMLAPLVKQGWLRNYLDDVVIWAPSFSTMVKRLHQLFQHFIENGVKLNVTKCNFGQPEVKYLGHLISEKGCRPCPDNIAAIKTMKHPKNVKEVRRFLGMTGFYRKHIQSYAQLAIPLTNLLRKNEPFLWTPHCQESFEKLKEELITAPLLVKAQVNCPFELHTDASSDHVGAVLQQRQRDGSLKPIAYFSKKLKPTEQRYSTTDREALAIILACRNFHHFLWGTLFTIVTDHQPLVSVFKRKTKSSRMGRWAVEMQDYRFKIQYNPGKQNQVADQLSRPVRSIVQQNQDNYLGLTKAEMIEKQQAEPRWKELITFLEGGALPRKKYPRALLNQFLLYEGLLYLSCDRNDNSIQLKLVIPQDLRKLALALGHVKESAHLGRRKTIDKLETYFYWPSLRTDVTQYVKECLPCQQHKGQRGLQQPWQELPPVRRPLDRISIDLTDMFSGMNGYRYVLTVLDHYSRFVKFYTTRTKTTEEVGKNFQQFLYDFGVPLLVISDRGGEFTSSQFQQLCAKFNITMGYTTPYHPRGNSLTERMHGTMKTLLGLLCTGLPYKWPQYLGETQRVLNTAVHTTLGEQPHFVFFSRRAPRQISTLLPTFDEDVDEPAIESAHELIQKTHLQMARKFRTVANRKRKTETVEVNDLVWVHKEHTVPGTARKLNVKWTGPYKVIEKVRDGAKYVLRNLFNDNTIERAAEKVKPYWGKEEWIVELAEHMEVEPDIESEDVLVRRRAPPRRLIEEME